MAGPREVSFTRSMDRTISGAVRTIRKMEATKSPVALLEAYQVKASGSPIPSAARISALQPVARSLAALFIADSLAGSKAQHCAGNYENDDWTVGPEPDTR